MAQNILYSPWEGIKRSLEGLMLKLKLQYFGHLMQRVDSLEKTLMLGGLGGRRRRGRQRKRWLEASPTRWTWVWVNSGSWWWTGKPGVLRFMRSQRVRHDWATELNWLCLMTTLLLFGLLELFSFSSAWLKNKIKLIFWLKSFHRQKAGRGHGGQGP